MTGSDAPGRERRRALIEEYKRTPKAMGVYRVRNRETGRCLIGSSRDVRARLNRHRMNLRTRTELIADLQADWDRYGADSFEFEVLELLEPPDRDRYDPTDDLAALLELWEEALVAEPRYGR